MARICIVTQDLSVGGGVLTKLAAFLRFAASRNHTCDLYFPTTGTYPATEVKSLRSIGSVDRIYSTPVKKYYTFFLRTASFARHCRIAASYDAYQLISGALDEGLLFVWQKLPFVAWIACTYGSELRGVPRTKLRHYYFSNPLSDYFLWRQEVLCGAMARAVVVDSYSSARQVHSELGVSQGKIKVFPAPVDVDKLQPGEPVLAPRRYILSVAQLERRKDFPTLLKAVQTVVNNFEEIELRVVGEGKERSNLERMVRQLGLEKHVVFMGYLPDDKLIEEYRGASLFVLSSRQEGIGIVFLEAMACGLPVVATDSGGAADPVVHGQTGFLVPVGDWSTLAQYMLQVLKNPRLAQRLGNTGREKAVKEYSFDVISHQLDSIYAEVFSVHPADRRFG
jgi:glycosyltransferase involved in cell wall biosynthesis